MLPSAARAAMAKVKMCIRDRVYSGMVVGECPKAEDIELNVCKTKKLTNTRSSSSDEALKLTPVSYTHLNGADIV